MEALAATAITQREAAASTAQQSAANLESVGSSAGDLAATPVQFVTPDRRSSGAEQRRAAASEMVSGFLAAIGGRAAQVTALGPAVADRYTAAASATAIQIAGAVEEHTQAITGQVAQLKGQAQAEAESARATASGQRASATAAIAGSTETARQQLQAELSSALATIDAHQATQLQVIEQQYRAGDERFRAAGRTVGDEAVQRGRQMAAEYMRGLVDEDDSFLDGPLTYNRGKARADTAREISKAYQSGLVDEANKQADQAMQGKARDIEAARATAQKAREALQQQYTATLATIAHADATARQQANDAYTSLIASIDQALAGSQQTLDQHQASLTENLRTSAQAQSAGAEQQAQDLIAVTHDQIAAAVASLTAIGAAVSAQVQSAPAPAPDDLAASLADATAQLDSSVAATQAQFDEAQALGEQQLSQAGQTVSDGLGASTHDGLDGTTAGAAEAVGAITSLANSAAGVFDGIRQSHDATLATTTATAGSGFTQAVSGVQQAYDQMSQGLEQGFAQNAAGLEQGLRGSQSKMEQEIHTKAEENADAVPPRWKSVLKWVLIIAVVVVVALVVGPFVIGAVGAALGTGAVMTGIIAGAIVGGLTSAAIQVINNWASNRPLGEGVVKAALIGAIGGAVGGGFGAYFASAAQAGTTVVNTAFRQFMANTAINVVTETVTNVVTTGHFSWEALGMSVLSAVAVGGAMHAAGGIGAVSDIQEASMGAGKSVGGAIRTGLSTPVPVVDLPEGTVMSGGAPMTEAEARVMYENARTDAPHNEAGIYRNSETGECIVLQGNNEGVDPRSGTNAAMQEFLQSRPGEPGTWELVEHSHPVDPETGVTPEAWRYPSGRGGDFDVAQEQSAANGGQPVEQTIGVVTERGNETITYGYDPSNPDPYSITYPGPDGNPVTQRFRSMEAYGEWYENQPGTGGASPHIDTDSTAGATRSPGREKELEWEDEQPGEESQSLWEATEEYEAARRGALSKEAEQLEANVKQGGAGEDQVEEEILSGKPIPELETPATLVDSQVEIETSRGLRKVDHLVKDPDGNLWAIEVKTGGANRGLKQVIRDDALGSRGGTVVSSRWGILRGKKLDPIPTVVVYR